MQPCLRATTLRPHKKCKARGLNEFELRVAVETADFGWFLFIDKPHKLPLQSKLALSIADAAAMRLDGMSSKVVVQPLPCRAILEVLQQLVVEGAFDNGA